MTNDDDWCLLAYRWRRYTEKVGMIHDWVKTDSTFILALCDRCGWLKLSYIHYGSCNGL